MLSSVHIADVSPRQALRVLARPPRPNTIPGLLHADVATAAPLRRSGFPHPQLRRIALVASWENEAALGRFDAEHPLGAIMSSGWRARLEPVRLWGEWPGIPDDLPRSRAVTTDGPVVVLTLARTRMSQLRRFLSESLVAERRAVEAPGLAWGTGLARPPFFATCSLWTDALAASTYAYGPEETAHPGVIATDRQRPFHHRSAFVRFRPTAMTGSLGGRNPLSEATLHSR